MTNDEPFSIVIRQNVLLATAVIETADDFQILSNALAIAGVAFFGTSATVRQDAPNDSQEDHHG